MPKVHKPGPNGKHTKTVSSDCAKFPHLLGMWVDEILQPIAQSQPAYFPNAFGLKKKFKMYKAEPGSSLFIYDVVKMYKQIPTDECIERLEEWL